jgi:hypothetical protein
VILASKRSWRIAEASCPIIVRVALASDRAGGSERCGAPSLWCFVVQQNAGVVRRHQVAAEHSCVPCFRTLCRDNRRQSLPCRCRRRLQLSSQSRFRQPEGRRGEGGRAGAGRNHELREERLARDSFPSWAVSITVVAVGLSPGLALLLVRLTPRLLHRVLWPRPEGAPPSVGQARGELAETRRLSRNPTAATLARVSLLTGSSGCPSRSQFQGQSP